MMKRFIFGFHRRGWGPEGRPPSRGWRMVTTAMAFDSLSLRRLAVLPRRDPRFCAGLATRHRAPASVRLSQVTVVTCPDARQGLHPADRDRGAPPAGLMTRSWSTRSFG